MPLFLSSILSSFLRADSPSRPEGDSILKERAGEGAADLEDDETTRRWDDEQSGLSSAKRLEARSCLLVSPSSRRPVVVGPEPGAGFPGGRPVDTIDRIDAIDKVGRAQVPSNQAATPDFVDFVDCVDCVEGSVKRRAGAGGAAAAHPPKRASLSATEKEIDRVHAGDAVFRGGRRRIERDDGLRVVVAQALPPLDESAVYCRNRRMSRGFCISLQICAEPLSPSAPGDVFHGKFGIRFEICRKLYPLVNHVSNEIFQAPDTAAWRPAAMERLAATPQLPLSA